MAVSSPQRTGAPNSTPLNANNSPFQTTAGNFSAIAADELGLQAADSAEIKDFMMQSYQIQKDLKFFQIALQAVKQAVQGMQ